jgi:hypothetical protein
MFLVFSFIFFSFTKLENRREEQVLWVGTGGRGEVAGKG